MLNFVILNHLLPSRFKNKEGMANKSPKKPQAEAPVSFLNKLKEGVRSHPELRRSLKSQDKCKNTKEQMLKAYKVHRNKDALKSIGVGYNMYEVFEGFKVLQLNLRDINRFYDHFITSSKVRDYDCNKDFKKIAGFLRSKTSQVEHIEFTIDDYIKNGKEALSHFSQILNEKLHKLKSFTFKLDHKSIQDEDLKLMGKSLRKNLRNLENFTIKIERCSSITDKGIKSLLKAISMGCYDLKSVDITISKQNITDKTIEELTNRLKARFPRLKRLALSFTYCDKITDQSVQKLLQNMNLRFPVMEDLRLNFQECNISDKSLKALSTSLRKDKV